MNLKNKKELLGTSGASLLRNILEREDINRAGEGAKRQGGGIVRAGYGNIKV